MRIEQPPSELVAVIRRGYESRDLDYKAPMAWNEKDKKTCCEIVKDILAMANTSGGFIVIGVSEFPGGFVWDGLTEEQAATYDTTRINRFLQEYADPPINALLRKVIHEEKTFVVVEVPNFPDTPHICRKDFPDVLKAMTLYVRTHNNESAAVSSAADFRLIVDRAVRIRSDQLLAGIRSIMLGAPQGNETRTARQDFLDQRAVALERFSEQNTLNQKEYNFYFEANFFPDQFLRSRFGVDELKAAAYGAHIDFTGWPFLFIHINRPDVTHVVENGIETFISTTYFNGYPLLDFWRLNESGFFFHRRLAPGEGLRERFADMGSIVTYAAEGIDCLTRLYEKLMRDDEVMSFIFRLVGTMGRSLTRLPPHMPLLPGRTSIIPEIDVERRLPLADWRAGIEDHAIEMCREIFLRFNWMNPNLDLARNMIKQLFSRRL
jgi:hypothetical protein